MDKQINMLSPERVRLREHTIIKTVTALDEKLKIFKSFFSVCCHGGQVSARAIKQHNGHNLLINFYAHAKKYTKV